ncbi:hypothetical protein HOK51_07985 [Candidatus Woesearchaeota archaeon]|jgi:hypothetical protein|nr:hypothetical protein [Candidatus Woesearchaeota archaeon]MBT6519765.1 hypothetical protein [Candidatus Woesearchaeota archaeon]MBT7368144.1 hypothetical protein [Candidatus Woesearchaeota archaeon]
MTQTNLSLKKLQGIKPKGVKQADKTIQKRIVLLCSEMVDKYSNNPELGSVQSDMYVAVEKSLRDLDFGEKELTQYIHSRFIRNETENNELYSGIFSGCLLELLCRRADVRREKFNFYIDGKGKEYNKIFFQANLVHELTVENFKGDYLCGVIGGQGGRADAINIVNCEGYGPGAQVAQHGGILKSLNIINHSGGGCAIAAGAQTKLIEEINILNSQGSWNGAQIGMQGGTVKRVRILNNKGDRCAAYLGDYGGCIDSLIVINSEGDKLADTHDTSLNLAYLDYALFHNISGKDLLNHFQTGDLIQGQNAKECYDFISNYILKKADNRFGIQHKLDLNQTLDSFRHKSYDEIKNIFTELNYALMNYEAYELSVRLKKRKKLEELK